MYLSHKFFYIFVVILILLLTSLSLKYKLVETFSYKTPYVKILWMYWDQGIDNLDDNYNKLCFWGWKKLNPDWEIRILDKNSTIKYIPDLVNFKHLTVQLKSDLLRIKLLSKYGGVWADASTLPMKRLTENINNIDNNTGVFFYRYDKTKNQHLISSWFIIARRPNNYLINKLKERFENKIMDKNKKYEYFLFHNTLNELYYQDNKIKNIIDKLTITQDLPHAPQRGNRYPEINVKYLDKHPIMYKRAKKINHNQYIDYINSIVLLHK